MNKNDHMDNTGEKPDFTCKPHELSNIAKTIAVLSGKGGVGKSLVTALFAVMMKRNGYNVGILDADITGPSVPKMFGLDDYKIMSDDHGIYPAVTSTGIKVMSINLLLSSREAPVIWRGPLISGVVRQFWTEVIWGDVDYLFIDMPPGTGDVPLTVFQSIVPDGAFIVTSPQDLVSLIVKKAYNMTKTMNVPILGIIENMSHAVCPSCGKRIDIFGRNRRDSVPNDDKSEPSCNIPIDPQLADLCDKGEIEKAGTLYVDSCAELLG